MIRRWGINRSRWRASIQETEKSDCSGNDSGIYNILKVTVNRILLMDLTIFDQWKKFTQRRWALKPYSSTQDGANTVKASTLGRNRTWPQETPDRTGDPYRLSINRAGQDTSHQVGVRSLPSPRQKGCQGSGGVESQGQHQGRLGKRNKAVMWTRRQDRARKSRTRNMGQRARLA